MSSLVVSDDGPPNQKCIPIGKIAKNVIYVERGKPVDKRVKTVELEGHITPIPYIDIEHNGRFAGYISGISGSGKSTTAVMLARRIREVRKDRVKPIAVFSTRHIEDPAYETLKNIDFISFEDDRFLALDAEDLHGRIVIFDDYENINDKHLRQHCMIFIKDVLERTRKLEVDIIIINHVTQDYHKTRGIIFECNTFFLNVAQNRNSAKRFLNAYMDIDKELIHKIVNHEYEKDFEFVVFHKCAPMFIQFENKMMLV